jgi:hypothetical protein
MNYYGFGVRNSMFGNGFGILIPFMLLELVLKGFALWKSARKSQNVWFIALLVVNSLGILPIIYLVLNRENKEVAKKSKKK